MLHSSRSRYRLTANSGGVKARKVREESLQLLDQGGEILLKVREITVLSER